VLGGNILTSGLGSITGFAKGFVSSGFEMAAGIESTEIQFEVMLGSAEAAKKLMGGLLDYANKTAFSFTDVADAARQLAAVGVDTSQIMPTVKMLGELSNLGERGGLGQMTGLYGKVFAGGKMSGEELRQFVEAGKPIAQMMATVRNQSVQALRKDIEAGMVGTRDVQEAMLRMTSKGGMFHGMQARLSQTLSGLWSTFKDSWDMAGAELAKSMVDIFELRGELNWGTSLGTSLQNIIAEWTPALKKFWKWLREESASAFWSAAAGMARFGAVVLDITAKIVNAIGQIPAHLELIGLQAKYIIGVMGKEKDPLTDKEFMRFGELTGLSAAGRPLSPDIMNTTGMQAGLRGFGAFADLQALTKLWLPPSLRDLVTAKAQAAGPAAIPDEALKLADQLAAPKKVKEARKAGGGERGERDLFSAAVGGMDAWPVIVAALREQRGNRLEEEVVKANANLEKVVKATEKTAMELETKAEVDAANAGWDDVLEGMMT
jgi:tape measure domain-containing protein